MRIRIISERRELDYQVLELELDGEFCTYALYALDPYGLAPELRDMLDKGDSEREVPQS